MRRATTSQKACENCSYTSEVSEQKREVVLRLAIERRILAVLFLLVEKDPYFDLEHEDLKKIAKI